MEMNGTLADAQDYTIDRGGELFLWAGGRSVNEDVAHFRFGNLSIRSRGKVYLISLPGNERITLNTTSLIINGGGLLDASDVHILSVNTTIDVEGSFNSHYYSYFY